MAAVAACLAMVEENTVVVVVVVEKDKPRMKDIGIEKIVRKQQGIVIEAIVVVEMIDWVVVAVAVEADMTVTVSAVEVANRQEQSMSQQVMRMLSED